MPPVESRGDVRRNAFCDKSKYNRRQLNETGVIDGQDSVILIFKLQEAQEYYILDGHLWR